MHLIENPTKCLEGLLNSSVLKRHAVCVPVVDTWKGTFSMEGT